MIILNNNTNKTRITDKTLTGEGKKNKKFPKNKTKK